MEVGQPAEIGSNSENMDLSDKRIPGSYQREFRSRLALAGVPPLFEFKLLAGYDLAKYAHRLEKREGGERFFQHPAAVVLIIAEELGIFDDEDSLVAAMLHDVLEDTGIFGNKVVHGPTYREIAFERVSEFFSPEVAKIVIAVTKPALFEMLEGESKIDGALRLVSEGGPKAVIVKLADRIHNVRTLNQTPIEKQIRKLEETKNYLIPFFIREAQKHEGYWGEKILKGVQLLEADVKTLEDEISLSSSPG